MVLESLTSAKGAERHPASLFLITFVVTTASMFISYKTFPESSSVLALALATIALMPILNAILIEEEEKEVEEDSIPFAFISSHYGVIKAYSWIFVGMIFAYGFWATVLPETSESCSGLQCILPEKSVVFSEQKKVYSGITGKVIGQEECFTQNTRGFEKCFELIFGNNTWVMVLAIIFSFLWGAGAIFLLGWNASVIGWFIASEISSKSVEAGLARAISYLPHGIPEILAYLLAALAGGIISAAIAKQTFREHELRIVVVDTLLLILLAVVTLLIAAIIETAEIFGEWEIAVAGMVSLLCLYMFMYLPSVRHGLHAFRKTGKQAGK